MSFTVYRSSAGSGKTFTLVKEYVKILLVEPGAFRHILAITFTNKAANEMRERILKALEGLAAGDRSNDLSIPEKLLPLLISETGLTPVEISRNAAISLEMILHNYADFAIGTIDSFSHKLIRTFAHDFGLPVSFNVELDADELLSTAVDLLLDKVGDDKALTSLLVKFLEMRMDEEKGWDIGSILTRFAKILLDEDAQKGIAGLKKLTLEDFQVISNELYAAIRQFEKRIREISQDGIQQFRAGGFSPADLFQGDRGIWKYFENLAEGKMKIEPNSYVVKTVTEDKWFSGKASAKAREDILAIKPEILGIYEKLQQEIGLHKPDYSLRKLLSKTIYPLAVLNEIDRVLNDFKRQNNLIHISEFNSRISGIVMNEPVPFIYERLGEKFRHILIDEFQDTSVLQWMNFIPLIENSLAGGYFNLVLGDGKQAIYRWRNGAVEQLNSLPAIEGSKDNTILSQRENLLKSHFVKISLDKNFRSLSEIVDFNNRFFRTIANQVLSDGKETIYDGLEQEINPQKTGGYISLEFLGDKEEPDYETKSLNNILEIILQAQKEQFRLHDMAILCRSNKNASVIARFLLEQGVEVVSAESLLLHNSLNVRFLIAYLKFLVEPRNDIVLAEIRHFIHHSELNPGTKSAPSPDDLAIMPVYDLCETLIRHYGLNAGQDPYLRFFLDAVLKFTVKKSAGTAEFLNWWEKNRDKLSIVVPEELDAVRVMTIHKAKGLEFPLVILPFVQEVLKNTKTYLWVDLNPNLASGLENAILRSDKDLESTVYGDLYTEERQKSMLDLVNLLYVAMTRPVERLYILTKFPSEKSVEVNSLPGFFRLFLEHENAWAEGKSKYTFGLRTNHIITTQKQEAATIHFQDNISSDWHQKIQIRRNAPQMWDSEAPGQNSQWGTRIHSLLSLIIAKDDAANVLKQATGNGLIGNEEVGHIGSLLMSVISDPQLSRLFSDQVSVKTEPEILLPEGSFYRPDRIVFDDDQVTILDYKTGKPNLKHREQLIKYAGYIEEMGYQNVHRKLVYLEPEVKVVEV
jgi:ATP-dependent exoDNAse (exonuclease V) beta subunit